MVDIIKDLELICGVLVCLAGGVAVIVGFFKWYSKQHDFRQKCEGYADQIDSINKRIDNLIEVQDEKINLAHEHAQKALAEIQDGTNSKLQEIRDEQCMIAYCMLATLDGLKQLNCNGKVTEARDALDKHLNKQAHGVTNERNND